MKKDIGSRLAVLLLAFTASIPVHTAYAKEWDEIDIKEAVYTDADDPQPFAAYIYIEGNEDSPFNNPCRDVTIYFGGDMSLYTTAHYYNFCSDDIYRRYGIVRIVGELPGNTEVPYYIHPYASDARATDFAYKSMHFDREVTLMDDIRLADGYNEFYFVGGPENYVDAHGNEKLMEMYGLFHSSTGDMNGNKASAFSAQQSLWAQTEENNSTMDDGEEKEVIVPKEAKRRPTLLAYAIFILAISIVLGLFGRMAYKREKADENTYED